jgi:protein ImuA
MSRADVIRDLKEQLRRIERSHHRADGEVFSSGIAGFDKLLPAGGLRWGTLMEWLAASDGCGAGTLALLIFREILRKNGGACLIVDPAAEFYPPAAAELGIPLERTVLVRPKGPKETLWALEQALRSRGLAVVFGWLGKVDDRTFRRLQLAAEVGRGVGFLLRPIFFRDEPSWAEWRVLVEPLPTPEEASGRRLCVTLLHSREGTGGGSVVLEVDDETGDVRLVPRLAGAKVRKSG